VDLRPRSGADLPGQRLGCAVQTHGDCHDAGRIHQPRRVVLDRGRETRRGAEDADGSDVIEDQIPAVDQARHTRNPDADQPPGRLGERQRQRRHPGIVGGIDHRVVGHRRRI